jgi:hypothetical protein
MKNAILRRASLLLMMIVATIVFSTVDSKAGYTMKKNVNNIAVATVESSSVPESAPGVQPHLSLRDLKHMLRDAYKGGDGNAQSGKNDDLMALLSLSFGVGGLISMLCLIFFAGMAGSAAFLFLWPVLSIAGLVCGAMSLKSKKSRGMAVGGLTTGIIGTALFLLFILLLIAAIATLK